MKYRKFGKLGIEGSAFGLGCMRFNGQASGDSIIDEQKAIGLIRRAIDGGVTYLDTAYVYLNKTSEIVVGKALQDGYREKVKLATKLPLWKVETYEDMERLLDLHPGSVSILGLLADKEQRVRLVIDEDVLGEELFGCHPCENTSSIRFSVRDLREKIIPALGHEPAVVRLVGAD